MIQAKNISCIVELEGHPVDFNSISISEAKGATPVARITFPANMNVMSLLPKTIANVFYEIDGVPYLIFQGEYAGYSIAKMYDRQEVALTFEGFTSNWYTNYAISVEQTIDNMISESTLMLDYASADNQTGGRAFFKFTGQPFTPLQNFKNAMDSFIKKVNTGALPTPAPVNLSFDVEGTPTATSDGYNIEAILDALRGKEANYKRDIGETKVKSKNRVKQTASSVYQITNPTWREKWNPHYPKFSRAMDADAVSVDDYMRIKIRRYFKTHPKANNNPWWYLASHYYGEDLINRPSTELDKIPHADTVDNKETVRDYVDVAYKKYLKALNGGNFPDSGNMPLLSVTPIQVSSKFLKETIKNMLDSLGIQGRYFRNIAKFLGLGSDHIYVVQSDVLESIVSNVSVMQQISEQMLQAESVGSLADMMKYVLKFFGYDLLEFATPSYVNNKLFVAGICPDTFSFSPILCNAVFEDEISVLQGGRNFNTEPTRLLYISDPFQLSKVQAGALGSAVNGVVVPPGVFKDEGESSSKGSVDLGEIELFTLTEEEKCRGVQRATLEPGDSPLQDIEISYFNQAYNKQDPPTYKELGTKLGEIPADAAKVTENFTQKLSPKIGHDNKLQMYHYYIAHNKWHELRHQNRTITISCPYSPYRIVGLPGIIIAKDFPAIVGVLVQIQSSVSSDGNNTQTLTFASCRLHNLEPSSESFAFMDDSFKEVIPWYTDFSYNNVGKNFYNDLTGNPTSSLFDWQTTYGTLRDANVANQFVDAVKLLKSKYDSADKFEFIKATTKRELLPKSVLDELWPKDARRSLKDNLPETPALTDAAPATPYITERYNRVLSVFS